MKKQKQQITTTRNMFFIRSTLKLGFIRFVFISKKKIVFRLLLLKSKIVNSFVMQIIYSGFLAGKKKKLSLLYNKLPIIINLLHS